MSIGLLGIPFILDAGGDGAPASTEVLEFTLTVAEEESFTLNFAEEESVTLTVSIEEVV